MKIRAGYNIAFQCCQETPMLLMLSVRPERAADLLTEHRIQLSNEIPSRDYRDLFGNVCTRLVAPAGLLEIRNEFVISDNGPPDEVSPRAEQWPIDSLPDEALVYLLGSRYCDTEKLSQLAWQQFGSIVGGWQRVKAICDYVHNQLEFGYHHARPDRTASEGHQDRRGVCRDFAHLAVALCRCLNIPARYCTGYLGDIGVPRDLAPMDFSAWFEAFLDGRKTQPSADRPRRHWEGTGCCRRCNLNRVRADSTRSFSGCNRGGAEYIRRSQAGGGGVKAPSLKSTFVTAADVAPAE